MIRIFQKFTILSFSPNRFYYLEDASNIGRLSFLWTDHYAEQFNTKQRTIIILNALIRPITYTGRRIDRTEIISY